jgi:hypothetical protein
VAVVVSPHRCHTVSTIVHARLAADEFLTVEDSG